jgi:hypothetical protein
MPTAQSVEVAGHQEAFVALSEQPASHFTPLLDTAKLSSIHDLARPLSAGKGLHM